MTLCEHCDGMGANLFMLAGRARFAKCAICAGFGTVCFCYGAAPRPPMTAHITLSRSQSKWISRGSAP